MWIRIEMLKYEFDAVWIDLKWLQLKSDLLSGSIQLL